MKFEINDRVYVSEPKLATYRSTGLVTNIKDGLVHVLLDNNDVQYRSGKISKIVKYSPHSLELLDEPIVSSEMETVTLVLWTNSFNSLFGAEIAMFLHCTGIEDAKSEAAKYIEANNHNFYWVSITKPTKVELVYPEPTIQRVTEE